MKATHLGASWKVRGKRGYLAALCALLVAAVAPRARAADSIEPIALEDYTVLARRTLVIGASAAVEGHVGVVEAGGMLSVGPAAEVMDAAGGASVRADRVELKPGSSVPDVLANDLLRERSSKIRGAREIGLDLPLVDLPPLPRAVDDPCTRTARNVTVARGATRVLAPGCYKKLRVAPLGRVELRPGEYRFLSWSLGRGATVEAREGGAIVNVRGAFALAPSVTVVPASLDPFELELNLGAPRIDVREDSLLIAQLFAPGADWLVFWPDSLFIGHAVAEQVLIEEQARCSGARLPSVRFSDDRPEPTRTPGVPPTPKPTRTPKPTETPRVTPKPTPTPEVSPTPTPKPRRTPRPTHTPEPTRTPKPTPTTKPTPEPTPTVTATPKPTRTPRATVTPDDDDSSDDDDDSSDDDGHSGDGHDGGSNDDDGHSGDGHEHGHDGHEHSHGDDGNSSDGDGGSHDHRSHGGRKHRHRS